MPRYDNLSPEQLETIHKFVEESDTIDAANPAELEDLRALVEKHWPGPPSSVPKLLLSAE